jgi:hypothetical protein
MRVANAKNSDRWLVEFLVTKKSFRLVTYHVELNFCVRLRRSQKRLQRPAASGPRWMSSEVDAGSTIMPQRLFLKRGLSAASC